MIHIRVPSEYTVDKLRLSMHESLENLYKSTPWSVLTFESYEMDQLLHSLQNPAHQSLFVLQHAFRVTGGDLDTVLAHCSHLWKPKSQFISSRLEPLLKQQQQQQKVEEEQKFIVTTVEDNKNAKSTKTLVETIRTLRRSKISVTKAIKLQQQALYNLYIHIYLTLGTDLRNGSAAEIALSLSMNGIEDSNINNVIDTLAHIAALELERKKNKGSRRSSNILMVIEKLAAAGCRGKYLERVTKAALESLEGSKRYENISSSTLDELKELSLWSPRPLLWLWRRGHLLHKVSREDIASSLDLKKVLAKPPIFDNPNLPLVVDVGCGLGVSLIGLLASCGSNSTTHESKLRLDWKYCNYLGGDLSPTSIQWAKAMTTRWNLKGQCQFYHLSTNTLLEYLIHSKIDVSLLLLQFPTPYRLQYEESNSNDEPNSSGCNLKLPSGPDDIKFMANPKTLDLMTKLLHQSNLGHQKESYLLVQSNCEDVSLRIFDSLAKMGLEPIPSDTPQTIDSLLSMIPTTRTKTWLERRQESVSVGRASGTIWSAAPYLPVFTETEVACMHQNTPIHRCLFRSKRRV